MSTRPDFREELMALQAELRSSMREHFDRDLPLEELLSDRWDRARQLGFGDGANVYASAIVMFDVKVGAGTWIGPWVLLDGRGGLEIGEHCSIAAGVQIYTHDSVAWALSGGTADLSTAPVRIGSCTHVGAKATILAGVTIGDHCVIGAHSLVNRDLEPYTVAFGTPARACGRVIVDQASGRIDVVVE